MTKKDSRRRVSPTAMVPHSPVHLHHLARSEGGTAGAAAGGDRYGRDRGAGLLTAIARVGATPALHPRYRLWPTVVVAILRLG